MKKILLHTPLFVAFLAGFAVVFGLGYGGYLAVTSKPVSGSVNNDDAVRQALVGKVDTMSARYNCWTGQAPAAEANQIPGGVIYGTYEDARPRYTRDIKKVGQALDLAIKSKVGDQVQVVYAFCK